MPKFIYEIDLCLQFLNFWQQNSMQENLYAERRRWFPKCCHQFICAELFTTVAISLSVLSCFLVTQIIWNYNNAQFYSEMTTSLEVPTIRFPTLKYFHAQCIIWAIYIQLRWIQNAQKGISKKATSLNVNTHCIIT